VIVFDISPRISPVLAVWPGDEAFSLKTRLSHARGDGLALSSLRGTLHLGAHADAPLHVLKDGAAIDEIDLEPFIGPCEVIEINLPPGGRILPKHLEQPIRASRVLFKTDSFVDRECFSKDFVALSPELIPFLKAQGCQLVGIDTPSVDLFESQALECHHALFGMGLRLLEGLDLSPVEPGLYTLAALPLRIQDGDGSPVRAVLLKD